MRNIVREEGLVVRKERLDGVQVCFFFSSHGLHMLNASRSRRNLLYIGRDACWPSAAFASLRNVLVWLQRHRREFICNVALKMTSVMTDIVRAGMQHDVCHWPYMISFAFLHQFGICFAFVVAILYSLHGFLHFAALVLLSSEAGLQLYNAQ